MFTFQVALSLVATCMVLKCYYNNPSVSEMPTWVRIIVLNWLAKLVRVKVPPGLINVIEKHVQEQEEVLEEIEHEGQKSIIQPITRPERCLNSVGDFHSKSRGSPLSAGRNRCRTLSSEKDSSLYGEASSTVGLPRLYNLQYASSLRSINEAHPPSGSNNVQSSFEATMKEMLLKLDNVLRNVRRLVHVVRENEKNDIRKEEWKLVASVIDACFFWVFMVALFVSSLVIFLQAPSY